MMQAYGKLFANVYNLMWRDYADRVAPLIYDFYSSTSMGKQNKTLLDVCCGTGQLAEYFLEKGFSVVGIDSSEGMLKYAKENALPFITAKQASFLHGDAACFELDQKFGLVVSTFDALNHLSDLDALKGCFHSVYRVLVDDGYFIFDLNTAKGLKNWNSLHITPDDQRFIFNRGIYDETIGKAWTKITGFVRNEEGLYERFDETVYNTVFVMEEVRSSLLAEGYRSVYYASFVDLGTAIDDPEDQRKVFFVAQK